MQENLKIIISIIYPEELELGKENSNNLNASFLDLDIKVKEGQFQMGLFDKRDAFPFTIVQMPYKSRNIPSNIERASNNSNSFSSSIKPLVIPVFLNKELTKKNLVTHYVNFLISIKMIFNLLQKLHRNF